MHRASRFALVVPSVALLSATALQPVLATSTPAAPPPNKVVVLRDAAGADHGTVALTQLDGRVLVHVRATGLAPGFHGFHVHAVGQCDGTTTTPFSSAAGHFNPGSADHGAHAGDLPPLYADAAGRATAIFRTSAFTFAQLADADGSAIIVHAGADNLANIPTRYTWTAADSSTGTGPDATTKATGDAGARALCGVVPSPSGAGAFRDDVSRGRSARALLKTAAGANAGVVRFGTGAAPGTIRVSIDARGLTPGFHGFHVHAVGQCDGTTATPFSSAGGHLNPGAQTHSQHAGDLPALLVGASGTVRAELDTDAFTLDQVLDADGGAVIVHAGADNLANIPSRYSWTTETSSGTGPDATTLATGDAGARSLCGVVYVPPPPAAIGPLQVYKITAGNRVRSTWFVEDASGAPAPDVPISLYAKEYGGSWRLLARGYSNEAGAFAYLLAPNRFTAYIARSGDISAATRTVSVHIRISTQLTAPTGAAPGSVRGWITPGYQRAGIGLYRRTSSGGFMYVKHIRTQTSGYFSMTLPEWPPTAYILYTPERGGNEDGSTRLG